MSVVQDPSISEPGPRIQGFPSEDRDLVSEDPTLGGRVIELTIHEEHPSKQRLCKAASAA